MKAVQWSFQRIEEKYLLNTEQYDRLRIALREHIVPGDYPESTICNIYYDTPDYELIRHSMEKPIYKEKFQVRSYGDPSKTGSVFMEIKKKFDGIVYKRRVLSDIGETMEYLRGGEKPEVDDPQILQEIQWFKQNYTLVPKLFLAYDRLAFRDTEDPELRLTFDRNIRFRTENLDLTCGDYGVKLLPEDQILMEVKIPGAAPVWLSQVLSSLNIYPISFSKYGKCYQKMMERNKEIIMGVDNCA